MNVTQIVPTLPPAVSGVGDYATLLAGELLTQHGISSRFIVGDTDWSGTDERAQKVAGHSVEALGSLLGEGIVLLHYVPYGYANRGCPFWLVDALERWKLADTTARRLILIFHEVYASGPPWSSAFWLSPFQRNLAARLARLADARRITTEVSLKELRETMRRSECKLPTTVAPVFSNIGEPENLLPIAERERQIVVFGSRTWREATYADSSALRDFCQRENIRRVVDVGAPLATDPRVGDLEVRVAGVLPAPAASALFGNSVAGYFNYPSVHLAKSGIFAAYCAHGLAPVTFARNRETGDGLYAGEHYVAGELEGGRSLDDIATAAHAWYREHRLAVHAHDIAELLTPP